MEILQPRKINKMFSFSLFSLLQLYRRFKGGMLEAHPKEKAIVVNYKLEAAVYGDGDVVDPMLADKKVNNKKQICFMFHHS
jgi:hypothetical protein